MTTAAPPRPCPALGLEVPIASIDKELRKLWEQDDARTNASLMNLVVYSEKNGSLLENSAIIRDLTREHACRAILVEIDRSITTPDLRAWITAHCHLAHGRKSVCCEQIAIFLTGHVTGRFRNTVFAHLNSDLPLVFWWQGELSDILTERLVSSIDRLLVDSSSWAKPAEAFRRILDASQNHPTLILQDHAWTRTWQFRVGVASIFDDPAGKQALPILDSVEIVHHPAHRNSALQLAAWLAVQARWKCSISPHGNEFLRKEGPPIQLRIQSDPDAAPISSLQLRAGTFSASITHAAGTAWVERIIKAPNYYVASPAPADPEAPEQLVALQLARGGKNPLFQKILPTFLDLLDDCTRVSGGKIETQP